MIRSLRFTTHLFRTTFLANFQPLKRVMNTGRLTSSNEMSDFIVKNSATEPHLTMSFMYKPSDARMHRLFNLQRLKSEPLNLTLTRISSNIGKVIEKMQKKKKKTAGKSQENNQLKSDCTPVEVKVKLMKSDLTEVDETTLNVEAWQDEYLLVIEDTRFIVSVNPPQVKSLKLPTTIFSGSLLYPRIHLEFSDKENSEWYWFTQDGGDGAEKFIQSPHTSGAPSGRSSNVVDLCQSLGLLEVGVTWQLVAEGWCITSAVDLVSCTLALVCIPGNGEKRGRPAVAKAGKITEGPGPCPFELRHLHTKDISSHGCFRVASYNILADLYADSDFSREHLFPHCPASALHIDYRKQLFVREIVGYNADIICLQEVDKKIYEHDLSPLLGLMHLDSIYCKKGADGMEGEATFFRQSKFKLIDQGCIVMSEQIVQSQHHLILDALSLNTELRDKFRQLPTVLQYVVLESRETEGLGVVVGNTHLYFHPNAGLIRQIQMLVALHHLESVVKLQEAQCNEVALLLCGDFNSNPSSAVCNLILNGSIPPDYQEHSPSENEQRVDGIDFKQPFKLASACGFPEYTNHVGGFSETLDYIFIDKDKLVVDRVIPMPSHEEVILHKGLPSVVFPSDHIALVCDLTWKEFSKQ
ncbi:PREDICTED: 2',5'-phosphodiesterase 12-like [Priapulus caudatus]|uniref:2',5'-phosphodiesterase 12-like n=1 Tax=Priapulus caudatus TaxID=37621 RepID=A0ABM1E0Y3_PRICU|nr:PREDICTED: 2',5'-phosphodiesterase 12-like [Priapulus caudatus]